MALDATSVGLQVLPAPPTALGRWDGGGAVSQFRVLLGAAAAGSSVKSAVPPGLQDVSEGLLFITCWEFIGEGRNPHL